MLKSLSSSIRVQSYTIFIIFFYFSFIFSKNHKLNGRPVNSSYCLPIMGWRQPFPLFRTVYVIGMVPLAVVRTSIQNLFRQAELHSSSARHHLKEVRPMLHGSTKASFYLRMGTLYLRASLFLFWLL